MIILSLVRSNEDGKIGFLRVDNRVCVALSRAKKGFFIVGNMEFLSHNSGKIPDSFHWNELQTKEMHVSKKTCKKDKSKLEKTQLLNYFGKIYYSLMLFLFELVFNPL